MPRTRYIPPHAFVRVDCDFEADGLWTIMGSALDAESLGLSPALATALEAWQVHFNELAWQVEHDSPHFLFDAHEKVGRRIAALVKAERPDLTVVYGGDVPYPGDKGGYFDQQADRTSGAGSGDRN